MPTVAKGFHLDPDLPEDFDCTPNCERPASHRNWWGIPYIVTLRNSDYQTVGFDVRRLDGGAWDRSTSIGHSDTLDSAVEICQRSAEDEIFECPECQATILAKYSGPMTLLEGSGAFLVIICPICSFIASKVKRD
ncbi:hypothetical protein [Methylomonas sp. AM2-LC]|uniref:hypothetical protein n=1 Tax=Methylomonas sp. AM2-LC TaxID=3153301 RepID=UPI003265DDE7